MGKIILRLDRMMVERKISLNELAERVGISNVNLSKIKNNKVTAIRFSTLAAICEVLDCDAGDILEYQSKYLVTLTIGSFLLNKVWAWLEKGRAIWENECDKNFS